MYSSSNTNTRVVSCVQSEYEVYDNVLLVPYYYYYYTRTSLLLTEDNFTLLNATCLYAVGTQPRQLPVGQHVHVGIPVSLQAPEDGVNKWNRLHCSLVRIKKITHETLQRNI